MGAARGGWNIVGVVVVVLVISSSVLITPATPQKVELSFYYETLCPYCSNFMVNYLPEIFHNQLIDIINLNLVPYGNAKVGAPPDNLITCQHGPYECLLNMVEACAIHAWPDLKEHYTFIYCVERLVYEKNYTEWESCFAKTGLDSKPVEDCYKSGLGKQLELQYAKETNSLKPPHTYVPWVTVNGQPLYEDYRNFKTYICKAYKGKPVPKACKDIPTDMILKAEDKQIKHDDHAVDTTSLIASKVESTFIRLPLTSWERQTKMAASE